jgi:KDO2-lipid IV(A) lauroyltransferase
MARRADANLAMIFPDMPRPSGGADRPREPRQCRAHDHRELLPRRSAARRGGAAAPGPRLARDRGGAQVEAPIIFVSAHFGNWQAARAALNQRGYDIGGLYRPFNNPYVNAHYVESIERVGGRAYARSRHGIAAFLRTLRAGGQAAMMLDQYVADGAILDFLGQPAPTSLSAAEMALKHDALLVPIYGLRLATGSSSRCGSRRRSRTAIPRP